MRICGSRVLGILLLTGAACLPSWAQPDPRLPVPQNGEDRPLLVTRMGSERFRHTHQVRAVTLDPFGKLLATVSGETVQLWDITTGRPIHTFKAALLIHCVTFSPDGQTVAAGGEGVVQRWDVTTRTELPALRGKIGGILGLHYSVDGKTLTTVGDDGVLRVWDSSTGGLLSQFTAKASGRLPQVASSPDGRFLVVGTRQFDPNTAVLRIPTSLEVWDTKAAKSLHTLSDCNLNVAPALSSDGKLLAAVRGEDSGRTYRVCVYDTATGRLQTRLPALGAPLTALRFLPGDQAIAYAVGSALCVWDLAKEKESRRFPTGTHPAISVTTSANGQTLVAANGLFVRLWDLETGREIDPPQGHPSAVWYVAYSPDGKTLASAVGKADHFRTWDPATGKELSSLRVSGPIGYAPDGRGWAFQSKSGAPVVPVRDPEMAGKVHPVELPTSIATHLAFSPDGKLLVTGHGDGRMRVWDDTGRLLRTMQLPTNGFGVTALAYSPDGRVLASGRAAYSGTMSPNHEIRLWNPHTGRRLLTLSGHRGQVTTLAFSPDARLLVSGTDSVMPGEEAIVTVREVATSGELIHISCSFPIRVSVAFSPDGALMATAFHDEKGKEEEVIRFWETTGWTEIQRLVGVTGGVPALVFSPDGTRLAAGCGDGSVLVWDVSRLRRLVALKPRTLNAEGLRQRWDDLASRDAARAWKAIAELASGGEGTVAFLARHVQPTPVTDPRRITALLTALDGPAFADREAASAELERIGNVADEAVREALANNPSAEMRKRLETFLALPGLVRSPETLRRVRSVQVLERIGSPEAKALLEQLSRGTPTAAESLDARLALERLNR